jgi:hypothetical protein
MPACPQCGSSVTPGPRKKTFCSSQCQSKAANSRRSTTRAGRKGVTNPPVPAPNPRPSSPTPPALHPSVDMAASDRQDTPSDSLEALLEKAHSRTGVNAFEIALIAKMRGISAWAPLRVIIAR